MSIFGKPIKWKHQSYRTGNGTETIKWYDPCCFPKPIYQKPICKPNKNITPISWKSILPCNKNTPRPGVCSSQRWRPGGSGGSGGQQRSTWWWGPSDRGESCDYRDPKSCHPHSTEREPNGTRDDGWKNNQQPGKRDPKCWRWGDEWDEWKDEDNGRSSEKIDGSPWGRKLVQLVGLLGGWFLTRES